ncbi:sulfotransferase [Methylomonas sp. HYX-M1]|uniref:tetratricopeptide repeat-containing sulfotransferase family protein n=1 Tax=Methylomonas sp. HYX-M1 TaxID=3139307 RepID=UPI00345BA243
MSDYLRLGHTAIQNKNLPEAVNWFSQAAKQNPKDPQTLACLGQALCWQGEKEQGLGYLRQSGQLLGKKARKSREVGLLLDLADQLQHWNDYAGAAELCKQAVQINPQQVRGFQLLALSHSRLNQRKPAVAAAKQALRLVPDNPMLAILLATVEIEDKQYDSANARLQKVLQNPLLKPEEKFRAHKEAARVLDKRGLYQHVFPHLYAAGEIAPVLPEVKRVDRHFVPRLLAEYRAGLDSKLLSRWSEADFADSLPAPVFVVGFMRSGTTLTQEVLDAHPDVVVADETDLLQSVVKELNRLYPDSPGVVERLKRLDLDAAKRLRKSYWQRARAMFGTEADRKLLVDKTTMNSIDVGLINCLFPEAKLIYLLRDPRDVCLSCFMQTMIPTPSTVHLLNWQDIARFYAQVTGNWLYLKPQLTMNFRELRYEDVVTDFEATFRGMFEFIGLEWNAKVSEFYKPVAGKAVASPSFSQVAQPLYSSSLGRWRQFSREYESILPELQPFLSALAYPD